MTTIVNPLLMKIEFSDIWQCVDLTSTCKWPEQAPATQGNMTLFSESKTISIIVFPVHRLCDLWMRSCQVLDEIYPSFGRDLAECG
jgi:hypothetical protein